MTSIQQVAVWGDSILRGVVLDEAARRYRPLRRGAVHLVEKITGLSIINRSRFGCTAPKAQQALTTALDKGLKADLVLLEFGGNDSDYNWAQVCEHPEKNHLPITPIDQFVSSMTDMIEKLRFRNIQPLLMTLPPIDGKRYFDWITSFPCVTAEGVLRFVGEISSIYRHQEMYSSAIEQIARKHKVELVDVRTSFLSEKQLSAYLCLDGIHPNEAGQQKIVNAFRQHFCF